MSAQIVIVHEDQAFCSAATAAFQEAGYTAIAYDNALDAMDALEVARGVEVLISCLAFQPGRSNGVALARMITLRKPSIRIAFIPNCPVPATAEDIGVILAAELDPSALVRMVSEQIELSIEKAPLEPS